VSAAQRKSVGYYLNILGTLWRHPKAERAGDAALGLWVRMLSYCADSSTSVLTRRQVATLLTGDRNGPRKLAALLKEELVVEFDSLYTPRDFYAHNPGLRQFHDPSIVTLHESIVKQSRGGREAMVRGTRGDGEGNVTLNVTANVSNEDEQNQIVSNSLSRHKTQDKIEQKNLSASALSDLAVEVRRMVRSAYDSQLGYPPSDSPSFAETLRLLTAWLAVFKPGDQDAQLATLANVLTNYFADTWLAEKKFPLGPLGKTPGKYLSASPGVAQAGQRQPADYAPRLLPKGSV
jgi:hypothetical protein